jgi:hypothetical protein
MRRQCFVTTRGDVRCSAYPRYAPYYQYPSYTPYPHYGTPFAQPLTEQRCADLFLTGRNVPSACCGIWKVGCTPGLNLPIPITGIRW